MKYLGEKSLSSFLSGLLRFSWHFIIVATVLMTFFLSVLLFVPPETNPNTTGISHANYLLFQEVYKDAEAKEMSEMALGFKIIILPYLFGLVFVILMTVKRSRELFLNFKENVIFTQDNVQIIKSISKLLLISSAMTFHLSGLISGLILLVLCEIFKNGTALQEEHDFTI